MQKTHYRAVWLSDIHLGHKDCKAEYLLDFLNHSRIDTLYLVGDIVDMWEMSRRFRWPEAHNQLLHRLMTMANGQCRVIYLPGNHDAPAQKYDGLHFGEVEIHRQFVHTTAQGKKLLLLHGDQFDQEVCFGALHAWLGDKGYDLLLFMNRWYNKFRHLFGYSYWSLAGHIKSRIKGANKAVMRFRDAGLRRVRKMGLDGIVCGHIHYPEIVMQDGLLYCNDGDWLENCSALTESQEGHLQLVSWAKVTQSTKLVSLEKPLKNAKNRGQKAA